MAYGNPKPAIGCRAGCTSIDDRSGFGQKVNPEESKSGMDE
jgi:hypothetical protein